MPKQKGYNILQYRKAYLSLDQTKADKMGDILAIDEVVERNIEQLQEKVRYLKNRLAYCVSIVEELKYKDLLKDKISTEIIVSQIEDIEQLEEFDFNGTTYIKYVVRLKEYDCLFYLSRHINQKRIRRNDYISHKIEGEKIKECNLLANKNR